MRTRSTTVIETTATRERFISVNKLENYLEHIRLCIYRQNMNILAFTGEGWCTWTVRPGLDPTFGQDTLRIGAMMYAYALQQGKSEKDAHEYAEKQMYEYIYHVGY